MLAVLKIKRPKKDAEFEKAREVMGREGVAALMHIAGVYSILIY